MLNLTKIEVKEIVGAVFIKAVIGNATMFSDEGLLDMVVFDQGISFDEQNSVYDNVLSEALMNIGQADLNYVIEKKICH